MSNGNRWIEVQTTKRTYRVRPGEQVAWLPGEQVISIEAHDDEGAAQ